MDAGIGAGRRCLTLVGLAVVTACGTPAVDLSAPSVDGNPFASLVQCRDAPYVGVFRGFSEEGLAHERNGSTPSSDVYGLAADGSVTRITTDLGSYDYGLSADGLSIFVSPEPDQTGPEPEDVATPDQLVRIDAVSGERSVVLEGFPVGPVAVSPGGSVVAVTDLVESSSPGVSYARLALANPDESRDVTRIPGFDAASEQVDLSPVWSPDGISLAYIALLTDNSREIRIVDVPTGEERAVYTHDGSVGSLLGLTWSADGLSLLTTHSGLTTETQQDYSHAIAIDVVTQRSLTVLENAPTDLVYAARDASRLMAVSSSADGNSTIVQTWTRVDGQKYHLTSSAPIGEDVGLVAGQGLVLAACALT